MNSTQEVPSLVYMFWPSYYLFLTLFVFITLQQVLSAVKANIASYRVRGKWKRKTAKNQIWYLTSSSGRPPSPSPETAICNPENTWPSRTKHIRLLRTYQIVLYLLAEIMHLFVSLNNLMKNTSTIPSLTNHVLTFPKNQRPQWPCHQQQEDSDSSIALLEFCLL